MECRDLTLAIVGSGGDGVVSAGEIVVKAAAHEGLHGFLLKSFGPQIRGGESSCKIRLSQDKILSIGEETRVLMCYNWADFRRFKAEIPLHPNAIILSDEDDPIKEEDLPVDIGEEMTWIKVPFKRLANEKLGNILTKNILSLGILCAMFSLPKRGVLDQIRKRFGKKRQEIIDLNLNAIKVGEDWVFAQERKKDQLRFAPYKESEPKLVLTGNEAASVGALWSGLEIFAGYPITPASDVMEWLEHHLPQTGGTMIQAEDEIASLGIVIGASFAGKKSMTATSGPGISLMSEMLGLAAIAEIPAVVINVQRGGPSTGLPTKTSQGDLLQACYTTHGDAPHVVLAPTDVRDCAAVTAEAFYLSEKYQIPVIVLSDQFVGQRYETVIRYELLREGIDKGYIRRYNRDVPAAEDCNENYLRYKHTDNHVSPMSFPGIKGAYYVASGLEHDERGYPTSDVDMHLEMHNKRHGKFDHIIRESFFRHYGHRDARLGILCWGSAKGPVHEAMIEAEKQYGIRTRCLIPTCLMPLDVERVQHFVDSCARVIIAEANYSAQFYRYLRTMVDVSRKRVRQLNVSDGQPLPMDLVKETIKEVHDELH